MLLIKFQEYFKKMYSCSGAFKNISDSCTQPEIF